MNPSSGESPHSNPQPASAAPLPSSATGSAASLTGGIPSTWNFKALAIALAISFNLQALFLPCMCPCGMARLTIALIFDVLVIVRILVAWKFHEQGQGWIFYLILLYASPLGIMGLMWGFTGHF